MYTHESSNFEQNNIPSDNISHNRLPFPAPFSFKPIHLFIFELVGGPYDGMLCYRNEEGLFVNGAVITERTDGASLKGHLLMPAWLQLFYRNCLFNYRMDMKRGKYVYGEAI